MAYTYISLGSICSVAISNNFIDFLKVKEISSSNKFPIFDDDFTQNEITIQTKIMENIYKMKFYHDFSETATIETVKEKYERRIKRFMDLIKSDNKICFVRDETKMNNIDIKQIEEFLDLIKKINSNVTVNIIIIIHNPKNKKVDLLNYNNENVIIINDTNAFENWTRPNINWKELFTFFI